MLAASKSGGEPGGLSCPFALKPAPLPFPPPSARCSRPRRWHRLGCPTLPSR
jgi:hypothetical protein